MKLVSAPLGREKTQHVLGNNSLASSRQHPDSPGLVIHWQVPGSRAGAGQGASPPSHRAESYRGTKEASGGFLLAHWRGIANEGEANEGEKPFASLTYITAHVEASTTIAYEHQ